MTKEHLVGLLNDDLSNELKHMNFYLYYSSLVKGLNRLELKEFLFEEAASEMKHVSEFQDLIIGLGGVPTRLANSFVCDYTFPIDILTYAFNMEMEVVSNYINRINDAIALGGADGKWVEIFLEEQIMHSRRDADNIKQMI